MFEVSLDPRRLNHLATELVTQGHINETPSSESSAVSEMSVKWKY